MKLEHRVQKYTTEVIRNRNFHLYRVIHCSSWGHISRNDGIQTLVPTSLWDNTMNHKSYFPLLMNGILYIHVAGIIKFSVSSKKDI